METQMKAGLWRLSLAVALAGPVLGAPPKTYPDIPEGRAEVAFVVARVSPGAYLPKFPECEMPERLCMDPAPFWFKAKVSQVLSGDVGRSLEVATTSHYGMNPLERMKGSYLLRLHTDGQHAVMPRYSMASLTRASSGELYLLLEPSRSPFFLPCAIAEAKEPIDERMFEESIAIAPDDYRYKQAVEAKDEYVLTPEGAVPRFGIPVRRLQVVLSRLSPEQRMEKCPPGDV